MNHPDRKRGEVEAMMILQAKGIVFEQDYIDTGSENSKPDLKCSDGRYIEVTHTLHNNSIADPQKPREYIKKSFSEQYQIAVNAGEAFHRLYHGTELYDRSDESNIKKDIKTVNDYFGKYDSRTGMRSEFNCNMPIIECSADNILREISLDKGKKHPDGNTDLFIFVLEGEFDSMMYLIETRAYNGNYNRFMNAIVNSPFHTVYVCVWDFEKQEYILDNPKMMKYWKENDKTLKYQLI